MKKRILSLVMAVLLIVTVFPIIPVNAAMLGDIDDDGKISAADARLVLRAAVGLEKLNEEKMKLADVNNDGSVKADDARSVLRAAVGLENLHNHDYKKAEITKNATCTEDGERKISCECGEFITEVIKATGHKEEILPAVKPTCAKDGLSEGKKCSVCNTVLVKQETIKKLAHTEAEIPAVAATCTTDGATKGIKCAVCNTVIKAPEVIKAAGHKEVIIPGKDATCTEKGLTEGKKCSVCGTVTKAQTEIPATGHKEIAIPGKDATCTETGLTEGKKCTVCGTVTKAQTTVKATGHKDVSIPAVAATCTKTGLTEGKKCSVCGTVTKAQTTVDKLSHTEIIIPAVDATCTTTGLAAGKKCSVCGTVTKAQTEIPALGHKEISNDKSANCTEKGLTGSKKCSVCGVITVAGTETPVNPDVHVYEKVVHEANCTQSGYSVNTCKLCYYEDTSSAVQGENAKGHTWGDAQTVVPTCLEQGYKLEVCTVCEAAAKTDYTDALGHNYSWTVTKKASCIETGSRNGVCKVCGDTTSEVLSFTACVPTYEYINGSKSENISCREVVKCAVCEKIISEENNVSHKMRMIPVSNATCTKAKIANFACHYCNYSESNITVAPPEGHKTAEGSVTTPATCTEPGQIVTSGKCSVCLETLDEDVIILPALGHTRVGKQTCTESVYCETCKEVFEPALGHDLAIENSAYGKTVDGFFCKRCGSESDDLLTTFNNVVNSIKDQTYANENEFVDNYRYLSYFTKTSMSTTYSRFDFGIYTSAIKDLYESEMANNPDEYTPIRKGYTVVNFLPIRFNKVSELTNADINSIKAEKLEGIKIADVLASFPNSYSIGKYNYDLSEYKNKNITEDVIKVTIDIKNEKYSEIKNLAKDTPTALEKIMSLDLREAADEYRDPTTGELVMKETEKGDGYEISMVMKLRDISSDGTVVYYFTADDLTPIAAIYSSDLIMDQTIDMSFKIGLFSLNGELDPIVSENVTTAYLFEPFFPVK